jgi:hypothetical protein
MSREVLFKIDRARILGSGAALGIALLVLSVTGTTFSQTPPQTSAWLEDFAQLKREMAAHYANLDWAVAERRMDLKQLCETAEAKLRDAKNDTQARRAIESFLNAFGDGHLEIRWPAKDQSAAPVKQPTQPLSVRLGFRAHKLAAGVAFSSLAGFKQHGTADSKYFAIGVLALADGKKIGLLGIALFSEYNFPDLGEAAASELGLHNDSACDDACADRVERKAADLLTAALGRQLAVLKESGIDALLVDITGNGGGTNWVEPAARTLTAKRLSSPRLGFIKHSHWAQQFSERLHAIEKDAPRAAAAQQKVLAQAAETYRRALAAAKQPVGRDEIWQSQRVPPLVAKEPVLYACGVLPYLQPGELPDNPSSAHVFYPSRYRYHEGVYGGPLLVLVDGNTASSAEYFAAMLADNGAAIVLGSPTVGAGCGYTNGGIPTILKNSVAHVKMPDGVRFRADGTNEVSGITPAVLIPWRGNDSPYQRAKRVLDVLPEVISAPRR